MKIYLALLLLFGLFGCSVHEPLDEDFKTHMIKSEKLHILMQELDMLIYERQKSEIERDGMRKRYVLTLSSQLKKLSFELEELVDEQKQHDQGIYKQHALLLEQNANDLEDLAHTFKFENLAQKLEELKNNCNSCHRHFKVQH